MPKKQPAHSFFTRCLLMALATCLTFSSVLARTIPIDLPPVDMDAPVASDKPVKVYIMSGQSNMLGFGRIEGAQPIYSRVFFSPDPSARDCMMPVKGTAMLKMGVYQNANDDLHEGGIATSASLKGVVALGSTDAQMPEAEKTDPVTVEACLEVPLGGLFEVNVGLGDSSYAVAEVDGQEVYRKKMGDAKASLTPVKLEKGKRHKITIIYQKRGSLALWLEKVDLKGMGDLRWVIEELGMFKSLLDEKGEWVARPDVIHTDAYMGKGKSEPLSAPACGNAIGPELGFGWVMGEFHDEPVIVMKADIGNRSLGWDILPPGSESYTFEGKNYPGYKEKLDADGKIVPWEGEGWYAGKQYDDYTAAVHAVLENFDEKFPQYAEQGFEVAGFAWWQGHKDGGSPGHIANYERNMVNLIKAWRKEFNAPDADWTIATVGFEGEDMPENYRQIAQAQLNVADPDRHPELAGTVKTIDARPFWRPAGMSPKNQGYHYHHNAETYMLVGDALGRAMVELKGGKAAYPSGAIDESINYIPDLAWLKGGEVNDMQPAMKPIMLDALIPGYAEKADSVPVYLRSGRPMSEILGNKEPSQNKKKDAYNLSSQLDKMISFYELAGVDDYNWQAVDLDALSAPWDYYSFDPKQGPQDRKDKVRYREIELPKGMENWYASTFDASKAGWKTGKAPFGQNIGELKPLRDNCNASYCKCDRMPNTLWEKEVLLMRTKMKMPTFDPGYRYRLVVGGAGHTWSGEGYALYINSQLVSEMDSGYYKGGGDPRGVFLFEDFQKQYSGKEVTVAVKGFLRMSSHKNREAPPTGHLNAWVQAAKLPPALIAEGE